MHTAQTIVSIWIPMHHKTRCNCLWKQYDCCRATTVKIIIQISLILILRWPRPAQVSKVWSSFLHFTPKASEGSAGQICSTVTWYKSITLCDRRVVSFDPGPLIITLRLHINVAVCRVHFIWSYKCNGFDSLRLLHACM